jgi:hypothetical protein
LFQIAVFVDLEDESIMEPCSIKVWGSQVDS